MRRLGEEPDRGKGSELRGIAKDQERKAGER